VVIMDSSFEGKVALVTGAGTGIGAAAARLLAKRGAAVTVAGRRKEPLEEVARSIREAGGRALVVAADVGVAGDVKDAVEQTVGEFGGLNLAVNNAGIAGPSAVPHEMTVDAWDNIVRINLSGLFYGMHYEVPPMLEAGGGAIVNVSSVFADRGQLTRAGYAAAKHGIRGLTRSAAIDYGKQGIRVNELQPGVIATPMLNSDNSHATQFAESIPMGRLGLPEELAPAICFLLSDEAAYITGAHLAVDGGWLA
jgi:NAD(P)-dependent dehydrogenase (short-subunit alcohol dehydrogenase family)